jgi:hypothetical protein
MNDAKLKQYLYEHPELLDDAFQGSLNEADRWAEENARSAEEIIALAKAKHPEIPEEKWAAFDKAAAKHRKSERKAPIVHIRWWQVAVAAVIVIVLTFTLVPPARAFAESVIRYIVSIFDGGIDIQKEDEINIHRTPTPDELVPPTEDDTDLEYYEATYSDLSSFMNDTGYTPIRLVSDKFRIVDIEYQSYEYLFDQLCVTYENKSGVQIYVWQVWGNERGGTIFENENDILVQTTVLDGKQVIGYVDTVNDEYVLEVLLDESNVTIMYQGHQDYQEILNYLQYTEEEPDDTLEITFPGISEFTEKTGYHPVVFVTDAFTVKEVYYQSVPNVFDKSCTTYENEQGTRIYFWQTWGNEQGTTIFENEDDVFVQTTALDGRQVVGYADSKNGKYVLAILLEDSNIIIMYLGDVNYQEILDALQYS